MSSFQQQQQQNYKAYKKARIDTTQFQDTKQSTDQTQIQHRCWNYDRKFKMFKMSKDQVEKVDNIHDQMGNIRREMQSIRKNLMETLGKNHFKRAEECLQCLLGKERRGEGETEQSIQDRGTISKV